MKRLLSVMVLIGVSMLLGLAASPASAQVIPRPMPTPPPGRVFTNPDWLSIDYHRVNVTIEDQIANTAIDMQFTNNGDGLAEGTFVFPLPNNAAVDRLTMTIDGVAYDAKILSADEARQIYDEIVRQYRDPALLEYIGMQAIQANVFPIPPQESRRIQIEYSQLLPMENGLVQYVYPMTAKRLVNQMSISVSVQSSTPIGAVYSPSHNVALTREGNTAFKVGYEAANVVETEDFSLYYGLTSDAISVNLLTYRASASEDGFFTLLIQPPLSVDTERIVPKDVILVIDQSGSMEGDKWKQAQDAAAYVLDNINEQDRFNVVMFSTGYRVYANEMLAASEASAARDWIYSLWPEGGTDINAALLSAFDMTGERSTAILFLTDGEPTEGVTDIPMIIENLKAARKPNARIFTFGIGDDVNTLLLDSLTRENNGAISYVRTGQRIDESVASLYNKINAPVLTDVTLTIDGVTAELMYPAQINDLFAGEQLTLVGRYRGSSDNATVTLSGTMDNEAQTFTFGGLSFSERAGGEALIARLWATRRIADMLNTIRLNGENPELVESIVSLSLRYGIITPYTSFLIEENDILTQQGRENVAQRAASAFDEMAEMTTGSSAVDAAADLNAMQGAQAVAPAATMAVPSGRGGGAAEYEEGYVAQPINPVQTIADKTFLLIDGVWTDTTFMPDDMETQDVVFLSDAYFDLLIEKPALAEYFALGEQVIVVLDGVAYQVTSE